MINDLVTRCISHPLIIVAQQQGWFPWRRRFQSRFQMIKATLNLWTTCFPAHISIFSGRWVGSVFNQHITGSTAVPVVPVQLYFHGLPVATHVFSGETQLLETKADAEPRSEKFQGVLTLACWDGHLEVERSVQLKKGDQKTVKGTRSSQLHPVAADSQSSRGLILSFYYIP